MSLEIENENNPLHNSFIVEKMNMPLIDEKDQKWVLLGNVNSKEELKRIAEWWINQN